MPESLYLYQLNRSYEGPPEPPQKQHHVVIADADTGRSYMADACTTDPDHEAVKEHLIGKIANVTAAVYFEYKTTGRCTMEQIAGAIEKQGLGENQIQNLKAAYRTLYKEELVITKRSPPVKPAASGQQPFVG